MEIWRTIRENDYYQVSNLGRVKSIARKVPHSACGEVSVRERILKPAIDSKGYERVALARSKSLKTYKVHRLVADSFIDNHKNKSQVNHINGIKTDNKVENLEWCTNKENAQHAVDNGLWSYKKGHEHHRSKLNKYAVTVLVRMKKRGIINREIAEYFNISISCVKRTFKRGIKL
jgi:hypothetical protein